MKRSSSDFETPSYSPPPTTPLKRVKAEPSASSPATPSKKAKGPKEPPGEWTPEKRACFMDELISAGLDKLGKGYISEKYGVTKVQINNAIQSGKKGNLRDKAVQAVRF